MAGMENLTRKPIFLVASFLIMIGLGIALWYSRDSSEKTLSKSPLPISMALENIELLHGENGHQKWRLFAEKSYYYKQFETIEFLKPKLVYKLANKKEHLRVRAKHGEYDQKQGKIRLWPNVYALHGEMDLKAKGMEYSFDQNILRFIGNVYLQHSKIQVHSKGADFDVNKNVITFQNKVEVKINGQLFKKSNYFD